MLCRSHAGTASDCTKRNEKLPDYSKIKKTAEHQTVNPAVEEDFMFHLKIAEISKNGVIKSLMMIIAPEIMQIYRKLNVCNDGKANVAYDEHIELLNAISEGKSDEAARLMAMHLQGIVEFSKSHRKVTI